MAFCLALTLCILNVNFEVKANVQVPIEDLKVTDVSAKKGYHPITGEPVIAPKVQIGWNDPGRWDPGAGTGQDAVQHSPERYLIQIRNVATGAIDRTLNIPYDPADPKKYIKLEDYFALDVGTLYDVTVIPEHSHLNAASDDVPIRPYYNSSVQVLTDLAVETDTTEQSIKVSWSEVKAAGVSYKITYAQVDFADSDDRSKFENSTKKYEIVLSAADSRVTKDPATGMLTYTISGSTDGRIEPGKPYGVTVEPMISSSTGGKPVAYNSKPTVNSCYTTVYFKVFDDGDYIRFEWNISDSFRLNDGDHPLTNTYIYEYIDGAIKGTPILNFPGTNGANINYYKIAKKEGSILEYQLVLQYESYPDNVVSDKVKFVPNQVAITPTKPEVPEPISARIITDLKKFIDGETIAGELADRLKYFTDPKPAGMGLPRLDAVENLLQEKFLLSGDIEEAENIDSLLGKRNTFHIKETQKVMNLVWSTFKYTDYKVGSPTYGEKVADFNTIYDIWVTDDINALNSAPTVKSNLRFDASADTEGIIKDTTGKSIGLSTFIEEYYRAETNKLEKLIPGQVYYIKLVAKKEYTSGMEVSEPKLLTVYYGYDGDLFPPPAMSTPPLKAKEITDESITLEWREEWYEVTSATPTGTLDAWRYKVWAEENGQLHKNTPVSTNSKEFELNSLTELNSLRDYIGTGNFKSNYISRKIDLGKDPYGVSDVKYKLLRLEYKNVSKELQIVREQQPNYTLDDYVNDLVTKGEAGVDLKWKDISVTSDPADANKIYYKEEALQANELYLFLVKPYREMANGKLLMNYYPAALVVSTLDKTDPLQPTPTVPSLGVESGYSDVELKVYWDYNNAFDYEIVYATQEDVTKAKPVEWNILDNYKEEQVPQFIDNYSIVVNDLFPDTTYFFWIRAKSKANNKESLWSNAAIGKTKDLDAPPPPRAVGMGSTEAIKKHNIPKPVDTDYITVEWVLNDEDPDRLTEDKKPTSGTPKIEKEFSYIIEIADNPIFLDAMRTEIGKDTIGSEDNDIKIWAKNLVQANKLIANRVYYVRMKTKVRVKSTDSDKEIVKESLNYSPTIFIITKDSADEYDGVIDPSREILPEKDYELIYDKKKKLLQFRFRSDFIGDNNVDQRLIARLLDKRMTTYEVDVRKFKTYPIEKWQVIIPDTVMQAFVENKISLYINGGGYALDLPYSTFADSRKPSAYQYGRKPTYSIEVGLLSDYYQKKNYPKYSPVPMSSSFDVVFNVKNDLMDYNMVYAEDEFTVKLRPKSRYQYIDANADAFIFDTETLVWSAANAVMDQLEGLVSFKTGVIGEYGLFAANKPSKKVEHWSEPSRLNVMKEFNITGYEKNYNPNGAVDVKAVANVAYGILMEQRDIVLTTNPSDQQLYSLRRGGFLQDMKLTNNISRQQGLDVLVRTYEAYKGEQIFVPVGTSNPTVYKGYTAGLLKENKLDQSQGSLTYGELFYMLEAFLE